VRRRTVITVVAVVAVVAGALNYGIWLKESLDLGGNALSGKVRDGHYFVATRDATWRSAPRSGSTTGCIRRA
jgi:hypothetical protein